MNPKYKRILLKLSGEALAGKNKSNIDFNKALEIGQSIKKCADSGMQIAIVIGGGNFWRGRSSGKMDRTRADHMGMLATVINAMALADVLKQLGMEVRIQTAVPMLQIAELYKRDKAISHLNKGRLVIFSYGTGNPYFSTDTAASLRAAEIGAEIILQAKQCDAVYDSDPAKNPNAKKYTSITFDEILNKNLQVMDSTAASMCRDNKIPTLVFGLENPDNIFNAASGEQIGTIVTP